MDAETVDRQYATLQQQAQQTSNLLQALAGKLSTAAAAGDANAREWALDLKEIALAVREEESGTSSLLQAIHALVDNHVQQQQPVVPQLPPSVGPAYQQPAYIPQPQYQPQPGGALQHFLGSGFGRAIATGAGFGIGDDIVNSIFDRF